MRVLITTPAWRTHFFNLVPLAWALRTAGHEAHVACEPELVDAVTGTGLTAVPIGSPEPILDRMLRAQADGTFPPADTDRVITDLGRMTGPGSAQGHGPDEAAGAPAGGPSWDDLVWLYENATVPFAKIVNDPLIEDLVSVALRWRPRLVVADALITAGAVAAAAVGAAYVQVPFTAGVDFQFRETFLWTMAQQPPDRRTDPLADWLRSWTDRFGLAYPEDYVGGHATVDHFPPSLRVPTKRPNVPMRYIPHNGPAVITGALPEKPDVPRVLMTMGLTMNDWEDLRAMTLDQIQETLDAVADLAIELVLTLPDELRDRLARIPGNTRVVPFVPLTEVLPTCSAAIHHGGAGTFLNIGLAATPQLLVCKAAPDAVSKCGYLAATGAGLSLAPNEASGPNVREALVRLLDDPSFQAGADAVRAEMLRQPSPNDVVPELEQLADRHRATPTEAGSRRRQFSAFP